MEGSPISGSFKLVSPPGLRGRMCECLSACPRPSFDQDLKVHFPALVVALFPKPVGLEDNSFPPRNEGGLVMP